MAKLSPWYGKISSESREWRLKHETQELTMAILVAESYEIKADDIIEFRASSLIRLTPGSRLVPR